MSLSSAIAALDCQSLSNLPLNVELPPFPSGFESTSAKSSCTISASIPIIQDLPRKRVTQKDARSVYCLFNFIVVIIFSFCH
jgi:hypothetical protein